MKHPLRWLCQDWLGVIEDAKTVKHERFGQYAEECEKFYDGAHNWMWRGEYARGPSGFLESAGEIPYPTFQMTLNRIFEAVAIFGPAMLHRYPTVDVTPAVPPAVPPEMLGVFAGDPMYEAILMEQQTDEQVRQVVADLKGHYLNWLQVEGNKKPHARRSITQALVNGLGLLFTELYQPPGGSIRYPRSRHISWKQLLKDPDAKYQEDVQWISIEWTHPVNLVEEKFGLEPGSIKGQLQSIKSQNSRQGRREGKGNKVGDSFDLITYYEIYSKNGAGDKLKRSKASFDLGSLGRYVRMVVAKGIPYPLNLPDEALTDPEQVIERVQWPVPFWLDDSAGGGWPTSELSYYDKNDCVWPISLFKASIGLMRFVNWCMSFMADKVAAQAHDYIAVAKSAAKEIKDQLLTQKGPIKIIELSEILGTNINSVIGRLEKADVDVAIFDMVERALMMIDKSSGLTELVYGLTGSQMRSATEAGIKNDQISVRPDDMAEKTDDWYSVTAMKECMATAWLLEPEDVQGPLGPYGTQVFEQYVLSEHPEAVVRDYKYRVAAGSGRKPNKAMMLQGLNEFGKSAGAVMQALAQAGIVEPWNAYATDVAKALDLPNPERYAAQLPDPAAAGPSEEEVKLQMDQESHNQDMRHKEEAHDQEMEHEKQKLDVNIRGQKMKLQVAKQQAKIRTAKARSNGK